MVEEYMEYIIPFIVGICVYLVLKEGTRKKAIEHIGEALLVIVLAVVAMVVIQLIGAGG